MQFRVQRVRLEPLCERGAVRRPRWRVHMPVHQRIPRQALSHQGNLLHSQLNSTFQSSLSNPSRLISAPVIPVKMVIDVLIMETSTRAFAPDRTITTFPIARRCRAWWVYRQVSRIIRASSEFQRSDRKMFFQPLASSTSASLLPHHQF